MTAGFNPRGKGGGFLIIRANLQGLWNTQDLSRGLTRESRLDVSPVRQTPIQKSGGARIPSPRLDDFMREYPAVAEDAWLCNTRSKVVERPAVALVLNPEYEEMVTEDDIKSYLTEEVIEKGKMPKYWMPDKIFFVDEIPKTSTGKMNEKSI